MALSTVTFNIDGSPPPAKKEMIGKVLEDQSLPSLLLLQENPWRSDNIKDNIAIIKTKYKAVSHKHREAIILYRSDVLKEEVSDLSLPIHEAFNISHAQHLSFDTFKERASFAKLTEKATEKSFVAISWHGQHKLNNQSKKQTFEDLLEVIKEIQRQTELPVILGGDFNIELPKVEDSIVGKGFEYYDYTLANRKTIIDFFVVSSDVELSEVSALGGYMYMYDKDNKAIKVFDHDPVQAMITFKKDKEDEESKNNTRDEDDESQNLEDDLIAKASGLSIGPYQSGPSCSKDLF